MRIVVVEDEAPIREGMARILRTINPKYEVVGTASDGQSGYELIQRETPELVIMDIRMPGMDGLEMLGKLRKCGVDCKVVILSAYSEFSYAKQAIDYGITSYLLKPIKVPELKAALRQVEETIRKEQNRENAVSLDNIFLGCINGQIEADESFDEMTREWYGFTVKEPAELFMVWMGDNYESQKKRVKELLEHAAEQSVKSSAYVKENDSWKAVLLILYNLPEGVSRINRYRNSVVPMLAQTLKKPCVFVWKRTKRMIQIPEKLREMKEMLEWNLRFHEGHLISEEEINSFPIKQVNYPIELEAQAKQALLKKDKKQLADSFYKIIAYFEKNECCPKQMKEMLIRFNLSLASITWVNREEANLEIHNILQNIASAVAWEQINAEMHHFAELVFGSSETEEEPTVSQMVQKAKEMIRNYYSQGITLEETARKLFVSEEYLSTQFKKETGISFTETVRRYRIEKVKQLLLDTPLKLNQIADLAGYSDPKYMSKVFKDAVGMLPGEFRKASH